MKRQPPFRQFHLLNSTLPVVILLLVGLGWYFVRLQENLLTESAIRAYQQTQLEIVRALARSVESYAIDQLENHGRTDIDQIEQELFQRYIAPVRLLENGDAWIYAPSHIVFDRSSDFPKEYDGKSMAQIFEMQRSSGASHYEEMTDDVMNAHEGVGWYIWLPDKGREIAAWTPVTVNTYIWTIGLSTPLPEILAATGAATQIRTANLLMLIATALSFGVIGLWSRSIGKRTRAEEIERQGTLRLKAQLEEQVAARTAELLSANAALQQEIAERQRTEYALQRSNKQLETMHNIGQLITSQLQLDRLLDSLAHSTARLLETDTGVILLLDDTGRYLTIKGAYGLSQHTVEFTRDRIGESIAGRVALSGEPLIINDLANDSRFFNPAANNEGLISCASVPLQVGTTIIGTLDIHSKRHERSFGEDDLRLLQMLAGQAAIAIVNARLYTAAQQEIAERKRTESALIAARDAAEVANRAKSRFLANMSHELRTPLSAMLGYTHLLELYAERNDVSDILYDLEQIRAAGNHLLNLINNLLDLTRIESGKIQLSYETFEVSPLVQDLAATIRPLVEQNENTFELFCPDDLGTLYADETKVRQVLLNLLGNAAKFTERGRVTLTVSRIEDFDQIEDFSAKVEDVEPNATPVNSTSFITDPTLNTLENNAHQPFIRFEVYDTGIGIASDQMQVIFEEFTQADSSSTRKYGGTGLGLTISRHFAQLMGGQIRVSSEPGKGSVFTFDLPTQIHETIEQA